MLLLWFSDEEACQKPIVKSLNTESKKLALLFEVNASPRLERARISLWQCPSKHSTSGDTANASEK
jgi:hypothetical protein